MINSVCGIRSTGRICTDLADALTAQGHEVKIAYGRETVPEKSRKYAVRIGSNTDNKLHGLRSRLFDDTGFGSKRATKRFIEWVKSYDPDVVHLHNIHGYYINIELLFRYLAEAEKPVIWTLHDCWSFTGHCAYFDYAECDRWKTGCHNCPQKKEYPSSMLADRSKKNWEAKKKLFTAVKDMVFVTPSEWLAEILGQSYFGKYPVKVINNDIDLSVFRPTEGDFREKNGLTGKKMLLGVASVWDRRKGLKDYIKLSEKLDDNYRIVLVGLSEEQIKQLPENVIGISRTNNTKELAEIYTAADYFLNLTYEDNYPTVNLEAQACGTPVISYRTGGSTESAVRFGTVVEKGAVGDVLKLIQSSPEFEKSLDFEESRGHAVEKYMELYRRG
ncbi:glycosyltransferase [uncultured Ruminococcus sp.]|uniref:glycosyltransferase n=1 Tax=uncultured Ruminococcus sp. TaxID=165186 RepID=UPI0025EC7792|nr:glycosyltransferase [uncultured Ruminococcus sp.]